MSLAMEVEGEYEETICTPIITTSTTSMGMGSDIGNRHDDDGDNVVVSSSSSSSSLLMLFTVGQLVHVERRAWPGINQPGGVGRIVEVVVLPPSSKQSTTPPPTTTSEITRTTKSSTSSKSTSTSTSSILISVRYVLDGRYEKNIDMKYVHIYKQSNKRTLRDRHMLLGRCQNCGSLRRDCGSCDIWMMQQPQQQQQQQVPPSSSSTTTSTKNQVAEGTYNIERRMKSTTTKTNNNDTSGNHVLDGGDDGGGDDGDDTDSIDAMLEEIKAYQPMGRKLKTLRKKAKLLLLDQKKKNHNQKEHHEKNENDDDDENDDKQNENDFLSTTTTRNLERYKQQNSTTENNETHNFINDNNNSSEMDHPCDSLSHFSSSSFDDDDDDDDSCFLQELFINSSSQQQRQQQQRQQRKTISQLDHHEIQKDDIIIHQTNITTKQTTKVKQQQQQQRRRKVNYHRTQTSILEQIGQPTTSSSTKINNTIKQRSKNNKNNKQTIKSHGETSEHHDNDNDDDDDDDDDQSNNNNFTTTTTITTPLRLSSSSKNHTTAIGTTTTTTSTTPSSTFSFASRDTNDSSSQVNQSSQTQQQQQQQQQRHKQNQVPCGRNHDNINDNDDDDDEYGYDDDDDNDTIAYYEDNDDTQFIQPEGNAEGMPIDIVDQTKDLSFHEIPNFLDHLLHDLENNHIPKARQQVTQLVKDIQEQQQQQQQQFRMISNKNNTNNNTNRKEQLTRANEIYQDLLIQLVKQGRDQCQNALRKVTNYKLLYRDNDNKKTKFTMMTKNQRNEFRGTKLEAREMRYSQLNNNVEEILIQCRNCIHILEDEIDDDEEEEQQQQQPNTDEEEDEDDDDEEDQELDGDDHCDDSMNVGENVTATATTTIEQQDLEDIIPRPLSPFDPHQHARVKKRQNQNSITTLSYKTNKTNKRTLSKRGTKKRGKTLLLSSSSSSLSEPINDKVVVLRNRMSGTEYLDDLNNKDRNTTSDCNILIDNDEHDEQQADSNLFGNNSKEQNDHIVGGNHNTLLIIQDGTSTLPPRNQSKKKGHGKSSSGVAGSAKHPKEDTESYISHHQSSHFRQDMQAQPQRRRDDRHHHHRETSSALVTMENFLKVNAEHVSSPSNEKENRMPPRRVHEYHRPNSKKRSRHDLTMSNDSFSSSSPPQETNRIRSEQVFLALRKRRKNGNLLNPRPNVQPTQTTQTIVQSICDAITTNYPNSSCCKSLEQVTDLLLSDSLEQDAISSIRKSLMVAFRSHKGKRLLQQLISTNSPELSSHVSLLVAATTLLSFIQNKRISTNGVNDVFSLPFSEWFLDAVVCQFVEAVFSTYSPSAWGLHSSTGLTHIREHLERLRTSLSSHVNMVERTSRCLLQELQSQQWRVGFNQECVFLSCFDPERWLSILHCNQSTPPQEMTTSSSRYSVIGKNLPRSEVDAIWCTMAFVASSDHKISENGKFTWDLLSDILLRGTLSVAHDQSLSPNPAQLQECQKEIRYLTDLVSSGALESVALKDSFLTNIVKRCVSLVSYSRVESCFRLDATASREEDDHRLKVMASRIKSQLVLNDTATSNPLEVQQQSVVDLSDTLSNPDNLAPEERLLLPTSALSRQCLALLGVWIARLPPKKLRINSFIKKTKISWEEEMKAWFVNTDERDPFQQAFSYSSMNNSKATNKAYFLEFAAFCEIWSWVSIRMRTDIPGFVPKIRASEMIQRIWTLLSDNEMEQRFKMVSQMVESHGAYKGNLCLVQVAAKVLTCLGLSIVGLNPFVQGKHLGVAISSVSVANDEEGTLDFVASGLLTCLDCSRHSQEHLEPFCFVSGCLGRLISNLRQLRNTSSATTWQVSAATVLLQSLWDKLMPMFRGCFAMNYDHKTSSYFGEHALSLILSVLYGLVPADQTRATNNAPPVAIIEAPVANEHAQTGIDEFGGVDDAALVALYIFYQLSNLLTCFWNMIIF